MGGSNSKSEEIPNLSEFIKSQKPQDMVEALRNALEKIVEILGNTKQFSAALMQLEPQLSDVVTLVTWDKTYQETDQKLIQSFAVKILNFVLTDPKKTSVLLELLKSNRQTLATICKLSLADTPDQCLIGLECLARLCGMLSKQDVLDFGIIRILILSMSSEEFRKWSLMGMRTLAGTYAIDILVASGLPSLMDVLRDKENFYEQEIVLDTLAVMAENTQVRLELVTRQYMSMIKDVLDSNSDNPTVQGNATWLIGALCKNQEARDHFRGEIDLIISLAKSAKDDIVKRKAKSALLALSFDEENMKSIDAKHALDLALSLFTNLTSQDMSIRAALLLRNISEETRKQTLFKLFKKLVGQTVRLMRTNVPDVFRPALKALANFAMRFDLQPVIYNLNVIDDLIEKDGDVTMRGERASEAMQVLTLLTNNPMNEVLYQDIRYVGFMLKSQTSEISTKKELAKLTLAGSPTNLINVEEHAKVRHIAELCRSSEEVVACKAAGTFALLATNVDNRASLKNYGALEELILLLSHPNPLVAAQAALSLDTFTRSPQGLELWLKFDSTYLIDAASMHLPRLQDKVQRLQSGRGLYANWGIVPKEMDVIQVMDIPQMTEWTLMMWFVRPSPKKSTEQTLVMGAAGNARIYMIEGEVKFAGSNKMEKLLLDIKMVTKGWHHFAVTCDSNGGVVAYLDGVRKQVLTDVVMQDSWMYFCNTKFGKQPFPPICDLRIYRRYFFDQEIHKIARTPTSYDDTGLPDEDIEYIQHAGAIVPLITLLQNKIDNAEMAAAAALANLATKESARREIIRNSVLIHIVEQLRNPNEESRIEVGRLLVNIA